MPQARLAIQRHAPQPGTAPRESGRTADGGPLQGSEAKRAERAPGV